jgi:regulator of RNase E activity RraA
MERTYKPGDLVISDNDGIEYEVLKFDQEVTPV